MWRYLLHRSFKACSHRPIAFANGYDASRINIHRAAVRINDLSMAARASHDLVAGADLCRPNGDLLITLPAVYRNLRLDCLQSRGPSIGTDRDSSKKYA
jgi:hypothetical protein